MSWGRYVLITVGVLFIWSFAVPTGGVNSAAMDRSVDGDVVTDGDAYLEVQRACDNSTLHMTVSNQFGVGRVLDVTVTVNGTTKTADGLGAGDSATLTFSAVGPRATVRITASGSGVTAHLNRSVPAGC